jgi:hypothetical protein
VAASGSAKDAPVATLGSVVVVMFVAALMTTVYVRAAVPRSFAALNVNVV